MTKEKLLCPECGSKDVIKMKKKRLYLCLDCEEMPLIEGGEELIYKEAGLKGFLSALIEDARNRGVSEERLGVFVDAFSLAESGEIKDIS
jgi:transposase-like protein